MFLEVLLLSDTGSVKLTNSTIACFLHIVVVIYSILLHTLFYSKKILNYDS